MSPRTQSRLAIATCLGMLIFMGLAGRSEMEGLPKQLVTTLRLLTVACMFGMQALLTVPYNNADQDQA